MAIKQPVTCQSLGPAWAWCAVFSIFHATLILFYSCFITSTKPFPPALCICRHTHTHINTTLTHPHTPTPLRAPKTTTIRPDAVLPSRPTPAFLNLAVVLYSEHPHVFRLPPGIICRCCSGTIIKPASRLTSNPWPPPVSPWLRCKGSPRRCLPPFTIVPLDWLGTCFWVGSAFRQ